MTRLFVGTYLSQESKSLLSDLREDNKDLSNLWHAKVKWVNPEKLHLTWVFLGNVEQDAVREVMRVLAALVQDEPAREIVYEQAAFWPSATRPRLLVLTPYAVLNSIQCLAGKLREGLAPFSERSDDKPYKPHITLCRLETGSGKPSGRLAVPAWFEQRRVLPLTHQIAKISLIQSHLGKGDQYETLSEFTLK